MAGVCGDSDAKEKQPLECVCRLRTSRRRKRAYALLHLLMLIVEMLERPPIMVPLLE